MKKQFLLGMGLAAALALGAGGILAIQDKEAKQVEAGTSETTFYVDITSSIWGIGNIDNVRVYLFGGSEYNDGKEDRTDTYIWYGGSNDGKGGLTKVTVSEKQYVSFSTATRNYTGAIVYAWSMNGKGNQTEDISFSSASAGNNLLTISQKAGASGDGDGGWNTKQQSAWGTLVVPTLYTVTKTAVEFDGEGVATGTTWPLGSDTVAKDDSYAVPGAVYSNLEHFGGWFTDAACTVAYTASAVTADKTLYAKYTQIAVDSYIYYVTGSASASTNRIYFFNEYAPWDWNDSPVVGDVSGASVVTGTDTGVLKFEGTQQYIYRIPVPSGTSDSFLILMNQTADDGRIQTGDLPLVPGAAYWFTPDSTTSYSADAGAAIDFLIAAENKRNAVVAAGDIAAYSICGISQEDAAALYDTYDGLSDDAKGMVDTSTAYTYDGEDVEHNVAVAYADIVEQLRILGKKGGSASIVPESLSHNSNAAIWAAIGITLGAATLLGVTFAFRKRRQD